MSYRNQHWRDRYQILGDEAEGIFEGVAPLGKWERIGWNRPRMKMTRMSNTLRHMPDYYCSSGHLVEVMGCGRDMTVKLKVEKWEALNEWQEHVQPHTALFVWNSHAEEWCLIELQQLAVVLDTLEWKTDKFSNDGNEYYPIPWEILIEGGVVGEP
jgi:hypothetical protein